MPTKKKTKKRIKSKRTAGKTVAPMKKAARKTLAKKRFTPKKKLKTKVGSKKTTDGKMAGAPKKQIRKKSRSVDTVAFTPEELRGRSGEQSGDLQGLSNVQGADSESVQKFEFGVGPMRGRRFLSALGLAADRGLRTLGGTGK